MKPHIRYGILFGLLAITLAGVAGAQSKDPIAADQPDYNDAHAGRFNCEALAGKHWLALTDPSVSTEDAAYHRRAAEAYEHLAAMSWPC